MKTSKHTSKELLDIYREKAGTEKHASYFVNKYFEIYKNVKDEPGYLMEGEELSVAVLEDTIGIYLEKFLKLIENGHSPDWSDLLAGNSEMKELALEETYKITKDKDTEEANKQLEVYCTSIGKDAPLFIEYFIQLFEEGEYYDAVKATDNYVKAYRKQISAGKSEVFASTYAESSSTDFYTELYCYAQADAYEKAIEQGKSENYALLYSEKYGEMIANKYSNYSDKDEDILYDLDHQKILEEVSHIE
jgi:hypothetical protein